MKRLKAAEKLIREYHYISAKETKPQRVSVVPDYNPHWRMNLIDRRVSELSDKLKRVVALRYQDELRADEIAKVINRTIEAVHKRLAVAHEALQDIPRLMVSHGTPIKASKTYSSKC